MNRKHYAIASYFQILEICNHNYKKNLEDSLSQVKSRSKLEQESFNKNNSLKSERIFYVINFLLQNNLKL